MLVISHIEQLNSSTFALRFRQPGRTGNSTEFEELRAKLAGMSSYWDKSYQWEGEETVGAQIIEASDLQTLAGCFANYQQKIAELPEPVPPSQNGHAATGDLALVDLNLLSPTKRSIIEQLLQLPD